MKKIYILLTLMVGLNILGQEINISTKQKVEKEIIADTALINFKLRLEGKNLEKTRSINREKLNKFFIKLNKNGIKFDNIETNLISDKKFSKLKEEKENGYETNMTFSIKSDNINDPLIINQLEKISAIGYKMNKGVITFKLSASGKTKKDTYNKINEKIKILKKNIGRDFDFVFSDSYKKVERIDETYYEVENDFSLKLRDLSKINKLIEIASKLNVEIDNDIEYSVSNLKEKYLDMYEDAYVKARQKAKLLMMKDYEIKNVKSINENRYLVDELERKINIANDVAEYAMPVSAASYKNKRLELERAEVKTDDLEISIPKVKLQNELTVEFIASDGKEDIKYVNELNLYSSFSKDIKADIVDLEISINTKSNKSMIDSNNKNAKVFDKLKKLLLAAKISYETIENISFDTKKYESYEKKLGKVIKNEQQATFDIKVGKINTSNYQKFLELINNDKITMYTNNNELFFEIKESSKTVNEAYNLANKRYNNLKVELVKLGIDINLEQYYNTALIEREERNEKITNYITNNKLRIITKDISNLSLMISILRELGIEVSYINYGLDNIEKYKKVLYDELLNDLKNKEDRFNKLENIETKGFKSIKDNENEMYKYYDRDRLMFNRNNYEYNLNISNEAIIKSAKENPYKIFVKPYKANMVLEAIINLK
ncbi:SIMPL domain-containing protein [Streptobacillus moniliformis]|uniref:SIMPL domain-containing protein n=1 Tax=Streptobacillus moniliformis TaxID=34105 RepID=UPI0007E389C9|nr:SIMPL domain-containing protein [Streptobacillus moniliformis]